MRAISDDRRRTGWACCCFYRRAVCLRRSPCVHRPVVATWHRIATNWTEYTARSAALHIAPLWSYYLWAIHIHDVLRLTHRVRFTAM